MKLKLINLNTWWGGIYLWDNIVSYLQKEQPDIVMLQECFASGKEEDPQHLNTAQSLAKHLNMPYCEFAMECILDNGTINAPMGNAIISKLPLNNAHLSWIHGTGPKTVDDRDRSIVPDMPRNLLHTQIGVNSNKYNLIVTHGVWAKDQHETELQKNMSKKISEYVSNLDNVILTGDFNVNENTTSIHLLEQGLTNVFKGQRQSSFNMQQKTNPGYATAVVDFVFTSPNIHVVSHRSAEDNVSDHQSQIVELDL